MFQHKIFKKFLLGGRWGLLGAGCGALTEEEQKAPCGIKRAIEDASGGDPYGHCQKAATKVRPSELPIYGAPPERKSRVEVVDDPTGLEKMICAVRKEVWNLIDQINIYQDKVSGIYETGKAHTESAVGFLREDATTVHRAGAIGIGGLAGLVMGLRGGWFKRIIYGSTGASAMAALCYPRESAEVADTSLQTAKYYFTIVYNFIYGDDQPAATEAHTKVETIPALNVTPEDYISEAYISSATCSCHDPASPARYPNCDDELDKLGEMMSDIMYWGFRFVHRNSYWVHSSPLE